MRIYRLRALLGALGACRPWQHYVTRFSTPEEMLNDLFAGGGPEELPPSKVVYDLFSFGRKLALHQGHAAVVAAVTPEARTKVLDAARAELEYWDTLEAAVIARGYVETDGGRGRSGWINDDGELARLLIQPTVVERFRRLWKSYADAKGLFEEVDPGGGTMIDLSRPGKQQEDPTE